LVRGRYLLLVLAGLASSSWFDFIHNGFLGKLLAYPISLTISVLILMAEITPFSLSAILLLTLGAVAFHSPSSVGLLLLTTCLPYLILEFISERRVLSERGLALTGGMVVSVGASVSSSKLVNVPAPPHLDDSWPL